MLFLDWSKWISILVSSSSFFFFFFLPLWTYLMRNWINVQNAPVTGFLPPPISRDPLSPTSSGWLYPLRHCTRPSSPSFTKFGQQWKRPRHLDLLTSSYLLAGKITHLPPPPPIYSSPLSHKEKWWTSGTKLNSRCHPHSEPVRFVRRTPVLHRTRRTADHLPSCSSLTGINSCYTGCFTLIG